VLSSLTYLRGIAKPGCERPSVKKLVAGMPVVAVDPFAIFLAPENTRKTAPASADDGGKKDGSLLYCEIRACLPMI
jgi:hypothetical protein